MKAMPVTCLYDQLNAIELGVLSVPYGGRNRYCLWGGSLALTVSFDVTGITLRLRNLLLFVGRKFRQK